MLTSGFLKSPGLAGWVALLVAAMSGATHAGDLSQPQQPHTFPLTASMQLMQAPRADFAGDMASADARLAADWVTGSADNQRLPFVIVDKKNARIFVFGPDRKLKGSAPVLLGLAVGDGGLTDMTGRPVSSLRPEERTTPAGRFAAEPGHNLQGEAIIWVDYAAKIAIHRLRPDLQQERRAQRLASASIDDNRISMGCVVVPVAFYENVVQPILGKSRSVVYVLPETRPLQSLLGTLQAGLN